MELHVLHFRLLQNEFQEIKCLGVSEGRIDGAGKAHGEDGQGTRPGR